MARRSRARPPPGSLPPAATRAAQHGFVNTPIYRGSTVLYPTAQDFLAAQGALHLRHQGHADHRSRSRSPGPSSPARPAPCWCPPGSRRSRSRCCPASSPAITCWCRTRSTARRAISATRCCKRFGVETTYYDPLVGAGHRAAVQAEHARGVHRGAGLAVVRDAGHSGDRRGRACARRRSC